ETINGAAADTDDWAESWMMLKNRLMLAVEPAATAVFNAIGTAMDRLGPIVDEHIVPAFQRLASWWADNGEAIVATVQNVIGGISGAFAVVQEAVQAVGGWFQSVFGAEGGASAEMSAF